MPMYYFNEDQMEYIRNLIEEELRKERATANTLAGEKRTEESYQKIGKLRILVRSTKNPSKLYKRDGKGNFIRQKTY